MEGAPVRTNEFIIWLCAKKPMVNPESHKWSQKLP
jgi:hypothetical protein